MSLQPPLPCLTHTPPLPSPCLPVPPRASPLPICWHADELKDAFTRRTALGTVWGVVSIVGVTPLLAYAVRLLPLTPAEFTTGLVLFCVVPTTLGVGVSLTTSAKVCTADGA